ncbi:MAG: hypothetical protein PHY80_00055 [Rickettsiales bacterium]|nr:hypothetical protein [Rickettsiales bacterium]
MDLILKNIIPHDEGSYYWLWNRRVFSGLKIPFIDKEKDDIQYKTYSIIEYTNVFGQKTYELVDDTGNKHKIVFTKNKIIIDDGKINIFRNKCNIIYEHNGKGFISIRDDKLDFFRYYTSAGSYVEVRFIAENGELKKQINILKSQKIVSQKIYLDSKLILERYFNENGQKIKEIQYRPDGLLKYIDDDIGTMRQKYILYFQDGVTPILIQRHKNYRFVSPKTGEEFKLISTESGYQILTDRERGRQVIDDIFEKFMENFNPLVENLGQDMANAYLATHCDPNRMFINFAAKATQPRTLKEFQDKYFTAGDTAEFKVGIIGNKDSNHSMCLVIPNPALYPKAKAFLFDSSFSRSKMKDGLFTDVNLELARDIYLLNSSQMQHGDSCTFFAMLAVEELSQKSFEEICNLYKYICDLRSKKIANDFELQLSILLREKFPLQRQSKSVHGDGWNSKYFIESMEKRIKIPRFF